MPDAAAKFLSGKFALVTGGGGGIGRAIALRLAGLGARVAVAGRRMEKLDETARQVSAAGGKALALACDVSHEDDVLALFAKLDQEGKLDILVNNAGIGIFKPLVETTLEDYEAVMGINVRGAFLCGREAMKRMAGQGGRIVNIGSVVSLKGYPNQGVYTASKHALLGLTKVMGVEGQKQGIIAQAVLPGGVDTELVGDARPDLDRSGLISAAEVADAVAYLLSQSGNGVTDFIQLRRLGNAPFSA